MQTVHQEGFIMQIIKTRAIKWDLSHTKAVQSFILPFLGVYQYILLLHNIYYKIKFRGNL